MPQAIAVTEYLLQVKYSVLCTEYDMRIGYRVFYLGRVAGLADTGTQKVRRCPLT